MTTLHYTHYTTLSAFDLMYDFKIVMECAKEFDSKRQRAREAIITGNDMLKCFDPNDRDSWQRARDIAANFLGKKNGDTCHNIVSVGHCHIDIAWLWPYAETRRKAGRSWANQLRFIDMYPQYKFVQSQAQLYEWVKEDYPEVFERIKQKAKEGRFVRKYFLSLCMKGLIFHTLIQRLEVLMWSVMVFYQVASLSADNFYMDKDSSEKNLVNIAQNFHSLIALDILLHCLKL